MSNTSIVRACVRCHAKKIKCSGYPDCRSCGDACVRCQPYTRRKKADTLIALKEAEDRVKWLESELHRGFGVDCTQIATGDRLPIVRRESSYDPSRPIATGASGGSGGDDSESRTISQVTLNATGEQKFLGPSSGSFFASHAAAILQSYDVVPGASTLRPGSRSQRQDDVRNQRPLLPDMVQLLYQSYVIWIHPLYLVFQLDTLKELIRECAAMQSEPEAESTYSPDQAGKMAVFYLVMALGATNHSNTVTQLHTSPSPAPSPAALYAKALPHFDVVAKDLQPTLATVQTLLLVCIYSSYGPIRSSQWQLAGMAMRLAVEMGLHSASKDTGAFSPEELNERNSVFWTAYAIEISLSYNLGRPPSVGDEHITVDLPVQTPAAACGILHIKHRQIQSRIVSQVYGGATRMGETTSDARSDLIAHLQSRLDAWRDEMMAECPVESDMPYPRNYWARLYHGTTFVLHRASPLCPNPPARSLETCLRSVGAYIGNITEVLRASNVPLSWMLVQGVVFAGLTMVITARTSFTNLASTAGLPLLLVDLPAWLRKCSVCLAIMNERMGDDLLSKLDSDFDLLADSTMRKISSELTSPSGMNTGPDPSYDDMAYNTGSVPTETGEAQAAGAFLPAGDPAGDWGDIGPFLEVLGMDDSQTYWDMFPPDMNVNDVALPWQGVIGE